MNSQTILDSTTATTAVEVHAISSGTLFLPENMLFEEGKEDVLFEVPVWAFYIYHPPTKTHVLFDLGMIKDLGAYPPTLNGSFEIFKPKPTDDIADVLEKHDIPASSIKHIILSHLHWDHHGDPARFPNATVVVGHGTQAFVRPAYPVNPKSTFSEFCFPEGRTRELEDEDFKTSFGPFPRAHDFFEDGSLYIIDAPGHMPGHQMVIAKTEKKYLLLGGDACHYCSQLAEYDGRMSYHIHTDKEKAKENLRRIHEICKREDVKLCLAHVGEYDQFEKIE